MHRQYLAFLDVDEHEASSPALGIGQFLQVSWVAPAEPNEEDSSRPVWNGQVLPPLPGLAVFGNLLLLITRPNQDKRDLDVNLVISNQMGIAKAPLWLLPKDSDLSAKKLAHALNLTHDGDSDKHKILRRILRATDFSQIQIGDSLRQLDSYNDQVENIMTLRSRLSPSQQIVFDRIFDSTNFIEFVTGPFGTGKTSFIALLCRCLKLLGKKVLLCCSTNAAVDTLAHKLEEADPELKTIRFHSMFTETRAINSKAKLHRQALAKANEAQPNEQAAEARLDEQAAKLRPSKQAIEAVDANEDTGLAELRQTFARLIPLSIFLAKEANGARPNFAGMSLMARCLAHAGLEEGKETPQEKRGPHRDFREMFLHGNEDEEKFKENFDSALTSLQAAVISSSHVIVTSFLNAADSFLNKHFKPSFFIGDEIGATQEAETLIPIAMNLDSLERLICVGDTQQLAPVIRTHKKKSPGGCMINEFAEALVQPLIYRLQLAGIPSSMFLHCFRCTEGLEQPSSKLFYQNKVINGQGTSLSDRPKSLKTVEFLSHEFGIHTTIPRLVLDLHNGICLTGRSGSRYNLHNISQTLELIEKLVANAVFDPSEIAIQSPYREQNARYRAAMAAASSTPFWNDEGRSIWQIKLMTVDSFQGGEKPCVILYV
jgi:hypothetical protein